MQTIAERPSTRAFWEATYAACDDGLAIDPNRFYDNHGMAHRAFCDLLGDVKGLHVLDLGCGSGALSVYLALQGAHVTAVDYSLSAVNRTQFLARTHGVEVTSLCLDAMDLPRLERTFHLVTGRYILHHIEPFAPFVKILYKVLQDGGRGVFFENCGNNSLLLFARKHLAGRGGIPRYGDDEEHPFSREEVEILRRSFRKVNQHFPELHMLRKLNTYVFKDQRLESIRRFNRRADDWISKNFPSLRRFSYIQIVEITK